ncbi:MAG: serine/threonine-protein kinase, partial [Pyrinomonadaceae bacterium]
MPDDNIEKVLGGRYRVDSPIEQFFLARLYHGTNFAIDRPITIKVVDRDYADFQTEIFEEARKISRISHPNLLAVTDLGTDDDGTAFVIYEAFDGESLKTAMVRDARFEVERAISIVRQSAAAVTAVRPFRPVSGMLVRPENILLASSNALETVKTLNFFSGNAFDRPYATDDSTSRPVLGMLAPETVKGSEADERTDVYTLGSLLYQMLAGEAPFSAASASDSIAQICSDPPPPMSSFRGDLPDDLERVILTAMAKNPEMRYQTVAEFSNELERFVSGPTQISAPASAGAAPSHDIWKTAFVVLAGISLLTAALIYATSVKRTDPTTQLQPDANG